MPQDDEYYDDEFIEEDPTDLQSPVDEDDEYYEEEPAPRPSQSARGRRSTSRQERADGGGGRSGRSRRERAAPPPKKGSCMGWLLKVGFIMLLGAAGGVTGAFYTIKFVLKEYSNPGVSDEFKILKKPIQSAVEFLDPDRPAPDGSAPSNDASDKADEKTVDDSSTPEATDSSDTSDATKTDEATSDEPLDIDAVDSIGEDLEPTKTEDTGLTENDLQLE